jgi:hypothetical protein
VRPWIEVVREQLLLCCCDERRVSRKSTIEAGQQLTGVKVGQSRRTGIPRSVHLDVAGSLDLPDAVALEPPEGVVRMNVLHLRAEGHEHHPQRILNLLVRQRPAATDRVAVQNAKHQQWLMQTGRPTGATKPQAAQCDKKVLSVLLIHGRLPLRCDPTTRIVLSRFPPQMSGNLTVPMAASNELPVRGAVRNSPSADISPLRPHLSHEDLSHGPCGGVHGVSTSQRILSCSPGLYVARHESRTTLPPVLRALTIAFNIGQAPYSSTLLW